MPEGGGGREDEEEEKQVDVDEDEDEDRVEDEEEQVEERRPSTRKRVVAWVGGAVRWPTKEAMGV
jgi:hypothetical protein